MKSINYKIQQLCTTSNIFTIQVALLKVITHKSLLLAYSFVTILKVNLSYLEWLRLQSKLKIISIECKCYSSANIKLHGVNGLSIASLKFKRRLQQEAFLDLPLVNI